MHVHTSYKCEKGFDIVGLSNKEVHVKYINLYLHLHHESIAI